MCKKRVFVGDDRYNPPTKPLRDHTHIRGYHACRPLDISHYYKDGIKIFDLQSMRHFAASVFKMPIDAISIDDSEARANSRHRVYFSMFQSILLKEAGHYLCYGSEFLSGVASCLDKHIHGPYHDILMDTGTPTIFICDVPIGYIPEYLVEDIERVNIPQNSNEMDVSFWINQPLPANCIIGHIHPVKIFNPLLGYYIK